MKRFTFARLLVAGLLVVAVAAAPADAQCVKFDGLAAGTVWGSSAGHVSGDLVHVENGIRVSVHNFAWMAGGTFGDATVSTDWFTSSPNSVNTNNINLGFDFTGLAGLPTQVAVKFRDLGGFENLSINGSPIAVGELAGGAGGGLTWTVSDFPAPGGRVGKLTVNGTVHSLILGGQEFWIDTLCIIASGEPALDHFKIYAVEPSEVEAEVELRGQYDGREAKNAKVLALTHFANPVSKNGERIVHDDAHLTFYRIEQGKEEPERLVTVGNQFGRQRIGVGAPVLLAVPTEKIERGSSFPKHLDHYKCYKATGKPVARGVTLRDQFGYDRSDLGEPRLFCLPVEKRHEEKIHRINNPDAHLVIYQLRPAEAGRDIAIRNQFDERKLRIVERQYLAVPSQKLFTEKR